MTTDPKALAMLADQIEELFGLNRRDASALIGSLVYSNMTTIIPALRAHSNAEAMREALTEKRLLCGARAIGRSAHWPNHNERARHVWECMIACDLGEKPPGKVVSPDPGSAPVEGWRPIETVPKDGVDVLLHYDGRAPVVAAWFRGGWRPMDMGGNCLSCGEPTHWMPLPPPPASYRGPENHGSPNEEDDNVRHE